MGHGIGCARGWYFGRNPAFLRAPRDISIAGLSREHEGFRGSTRSSPRFQMTRPRLPVTRWSIRSRHFSRPLPRFFFFFSISCCTGVFGDSWRLLAARGRSNLRVDNPREILIARLERVVCMVKLRRGDVRFDGSSH